MLWSGRHRDTLDIETFAGDNEHIARSSAALSQR
jgi:hypothetical protein